MTSEQLVKIFANAKSASIELFTPHLKKCFDRYEINTPLRQAHFLAQIGHESGELKYVREIWGPTEAQKRYEGRKDLGNVIHGDGKRFMGRGLIQITGRTNYAAASNEMFGDDRLLITPELLAEPNAAVMSAGWFWKGRKLNLLADADDIKKVTKRINGGYNGILDRQRLLTLAKAQLM